MFKDDLKAAMEKENVSVEELAEYLGVSVRTVYNWKSGQLFPKTKIFDDICDLFKLPKDSYSKEREYKALKRPHPKAGIGFIFDGQKLKDLRNRRKWTQKQLGECIGVSGKAVGNWESECTIPGIVSLRSLCGLFGVKEDYFKKPEKKTDEYVYKDVVVPVFKVFKDADNKENPSKPVEAMKIREVIAKTNDLEERLKDLANDLDRRIDRLDSLVTEYKNAVVDLSVKVDLIANYLDVVDRSDSLSAYVTGRIEQVIKDERTREEIRGCSYKSTEEMALKAIVKLLLEGDKQ